MSDFSTSPTDSADELLQLFWQRLGPLAEAEQAEPSERDAARRIVAAIGPTATAISLAATYVIEFTSDLPTLADELERPAPETLRMTPQPPTGRALIAATALRQGQRQQRIGDLPGAERIFRWATQIFHTLGEREAESVALMLLGRVAQMQERLADAAQCYRESLAIDRAVGNELDEGVDLALLAQVAWLGGELDEAERLALEALAIHQRLADRRNIPSTLATLSEVAKARGQLWQATSYTLQRWVAQLRSR